MEWFLLIILILAMVLTDIGALGLLIWVVEHDFEPAVKVEGIGVSVKDGVVTLNGSVGRHAEKVDPKEVTLESIPESERWNPMPGPEGHKMPEAASDDEDSEGRSDNESLAEAGIQEAEHEQMLQATSQRKGSGKPRKFTKWPS